MKDKSLSMLGRLRGQKDIMSSGLVITSTTFFFIGNEERKCALVSPLGWDFKHYIF